MLDVLEDLDAEQKRTLCTAHGDQVWLEGVNLFVEILPDIVVEILQPARLGRAHAKQGSGYLVVVAREVEAIISGVEEVDLEAVVLQDTRQQGDARRDQGLAPEIRIDEKNVESHPSSPFRSLVEIRLSLPYHIFRIEEGHRARDALVERLGICRYGYVRVLGRLVRHAAMADEVGYLPRASAPIEPLPVAR